MWSGPARVFGSVKPLSTTTGICACNYDNDVIASHEMGSLFKLPTVAGTDVSGHLLIRKLHVIANWKYQPFAPRSYIGLSNKPARFILI